MPLSAGDKLGPYEILARLGGGGMGEVFKARDTRLGRIVAVKVARDRFSSRFEQEARAAATLSHPNICQLYDVGPDYLVMEFVNGSPIVPPDSPRKLLELAVQIADGIAAAHAANLIHRDLKPHNILVTGDGLVKILDFGLAKSTTPSRDNTMDATTLTAQGALVGTVQYMSPEQARGNTDLTAQSDQFSFGLVLYELCAGKRAFLRASHAETLAAIIREDAEPLPSSVLAPVRWVIERLLAKDPAERYDSTRDLFRELRQIRERFAEATSPNEKVARPLTSKRRSALLMILSGTACLAAAVTAIMLSLTPSVPDLSAYRFTPLARTDATESDPSWSPDGKNIVFTSNVHGLDQVFTKAIDSRDSAQISHSTTNCRYPFWSHDGGTIYYFSINAMWAVPASGGASELILDNTSEATIHPDGQTVVFVRNGNLLATSLKGGQPREFGQKQLAAAQVGSPEFSPDGSKVIATIGAEVWLFQFPSGVPRKVPGASGMYPIWLPDSRHVVARQETSAFTLSIVDTVDGTRQMIYTTPEYMEPGSVSPDGKRLAYTKGLTEWDVLEISLSSGAVHTTMTGSGVMSWWPDWAPSGTHYLVSTDRSGIFAIEDVSTTDGFSRRLLIEASNQLGFGGVRWAPDGSRFAFVDLSREGKARLMLSSAAGGSVVTLDTDTGPTTLSPSWSPDGQWVAYLRSNSGRKQLVKIRASAGAAPVVLADLAVVYGLPYPMPQWSPSGDWIAYQRPDGLAIISSDGKTTHRMTAAKLQVFGFSRDGGQLFGIVDNAPGTGARWELHSVDVRTGADKLLGPVDLPASANSLAGFSLHPDGKHFLTSVGKWSFDIWMLEGFDRRKGWLSGLLHR